MALEIPGFEKNCANCLSYRRAFGGLPRRARHGLFSFPATFRAFLGTPPWRCYGGYLAPIAFGRLTHKGLWERLRRATRVCVYGSRGRIEGGRGQAIIDYLWTRTQRPIECNEQRS